MKKLNKKKIEDIFALTPMQEGMLFHYLEDPGGDYYFEQLNLDISGEIDPDIFEKAWNFVIETNEMLRTLFRWEDVENPIQIILKDYKIQPGYYDFSGEEPGEKQKRLEEVMIKDREKKFDLQGVPSRINLCKLEKDKYRVIVSNHHILYDGWSTGIILKEFFKAYDDLSKGKAPVKPLKTRFKEFIHWVRNQDIKKQEEYWRGYLEGFDTCTQLPVKRKKAAQVNHNKTYPWKWGREKTNEITDFLKKHQLTLASLLYTAWGILLQRYNNSDDVVFGITVSGRSAKLAGIEDMVGLFINTLPMRTRTRPHEKAGDLLKQMETELHLRQNYEHSSLVNIRKWSEMNKEQELFDTLVILENYPLENRFMLENRHLSIDKFEIFEMTHYDLTVSITTFDEIELKVIYHSDLFDDESIERLMAHFAGIVESFMENPGQLTTGIEITSKEEKNKILYDFNDTQVEYPADKTIHQLFAEQVERTPDHTALIGAMQSAEHKAQSIEPDKERHAPCAMRCALTYRELEKKSGQLARYLLYIGVNAGELLGIMVDRTVEMIIGITAILKTGSGYVPLNPNTPAPRNRYILDECNIKILLTTSTLATAEKINFDKEMVYLDTAADSDIECCKSMDCNLQRDRVLSANEHFYLTESLNPAYVIYTSGSTGKPRGVLITHSNLSPLMHWGYDHLGLGSMDRVVQNLSYYFDWSAWEIFITITSGASLYMIPGELLLDSLSYMNFLNSNQITVLHITPTHLKSLVYANNEQKLNTLNYLCIGAEKLTDDLVKRSNGILNKTCRVFNMYGPTESTIMAAVLEIPGNKENTYKNLSSVPIGKSIANGFLFILDRNLNFSPIWIGGELYIGGDGVSKGYLNNIDMTAKKFVTLNQHYNHSAPVYKTGDFVRWLPDGTVEFLGRIDHQVKIRGFRVELGEIENCLLDHEDIKEAIVTAKEDNKKETCLCAFIISEKKFAVPELRAYLAGRLPGYMIPSFFKQIGKIPLTPNGKVDLKTLMSFAAAPGLETGAAYIPPKSHIEKTIASIWMELLGLEKLGVHDNFFDIGGNSLTIIRLNSRLKKVLKKDIPMAAMFTYPTISAMAAHLSEGDKEKKKPGIGRETRKNVVNIAIIGMSCRFPGVKNIHEFWDNIKNGIESITFFAKEELIKMGVEEELMNDRYYVPAKGILDDKEYFDTTFFDYTPAEAEIMDPQMRLFHECCWEGLEDAGYDPGAYDGLIGLYAGASSNPFWEIPHLNSNTDYFERWGALQLSDKDYISTRLGYKLGLKGPCITLQTACSTSLAAVDLACQGLLYQACDMALAGGVSITMHDEPGYHYREGAVMSRDGHCRPFDARATGTLGGNGAGVVLLKSLEDAIGDRDHIYAVIKSSAVNNDGKNKVGYTSPGVEGQANVIRTALQKAGVEPGSIGYIETHGTGTVLGDPIEIEGLKQAFNSLEGAGACPGNTCALGSVKANIGHLDAAAGIAGFIKTVLALKHGLIPPSLHFETINPEIHLKNSPFYINTRLCSWKNHESPRRAGVSSFGIGGTNAHVILEQAPVIGHSSLVIGEKRKEREYQLILLSAKTETALEQMTGNLADYFKRNPKINLDNAAYTLQVGRKAFKYRRKLVCSHPGEAIQALSSPEPWKVKTFFSKEETRSVIFMFPGLGAQYFNMGLELYRAEPIFHEEMDRCLQIVKSIWGYDLKDILYPGISVSEVRGSKSGDSAGLPGTGNSPLERGAPQERGVSPGIDQIEIAQLVVFIIEYALARLLMRWGITPNAMIGYSFGEYAAACLSGVFSLEDALQVIVSRGKLLTRVPTGAMLSVPLSHPEVKPLLTRELSVAIDNGLSCIVAGPGEAVAAFEKKIKQKKIMCMPVIHSLAMHSQMVQPILVKFEQELKNIVLNPPGIPYISNVTGTWLTAAQAVTPRYWSQHLRKTVRFAEGIRELLKQPRPLFIEIGPALDLSGIVSRFIDDNNGQKILNLMKSSREKVSDVYYLLDKIGNLWLYGLNIPWAAFYRGEERNRIPLPTYPFEGKFFPVHTDSLPLSTGRQAQQKSLTANRNASVSDWFYTPVWEQALPIKSFCGCFTGQGGQFFKRAPLAAGGKSHDRDYWLVFINETGFGDALIRHLREMKKQTAEVITVRIGSAFAGVEPREFIINPKQGNDYDRLFHQLKKSQKVPGTIVHLWGISEESSRAPVEDVERCLDRGFFSLLEIVQALGRQNIIDKIRIEVITNGMYEVTGEEFLQSAAAAVTAAIKVIPLEYDNISCRVTDIVKPVPGSVKEAELARRLAQEFGFSAEYPDSIRAIRGNHYWRQTMKPIRLEQPVSIPQRLKQGGVYLVTGGLGGIGLTLAEHLAKSIKPKLILLGRTPFPGKEQWTQWLSNHKKEDEISLKINKLRQLEAIGAEIMAAAADIADVREMDRVMSRALEKFKTIDGILHAAGVADTNGIIQGRTREMTERVLAPKVKGILVLDHLLKLKKIEPGFIVLFSSLANAAPEINFGQVGYLAANEFLDAYACYKTAVEGIFTVSINWPAWEEKGMWAKAAAQWYEKNKNMDNPAYQPIFANTLSPLHGIDVFCRILDSPPLRLKRVAVSPVDLTVFVQQCQALRTAAKQETGSKTSCHPQKHPRTELTTPYAAPANKTQQALVDLFEEFFSIEKIGIRDNFFELGGDSLKAVNLSARIHKKLHIEIPLVEFFNRPFIESLAQYILDKEEIDPYSSIESLERKEYYELSSAQKRLFIIQQMDPGNIAYNCPFIFMLKGNLKIGKLERVLRFLITRHESFRTCFRVIDDQPVQRIKEEVKVEVEEEEQTTEDRRQRTEEERQKTDGRGQTTENKVSTNLSSVFRHLSSEFIRPFDLSQAPLLRIGLIKIETQKQFLILDMHHIISDGTSMNVLAKDFMFFYDGEKLPGLRIQYKDFSDWQNSEKAKDSMHRQEAYWVKKFEEEIPILNLPTDYTRPPVQSYEGNRLNFELNNQEVRALKDYVAKEGVTLFMVLLAAYNILLSKISNQEDIIVGTPIEGRRHTDLEPLIGMFVNTLVLRNYPSGNKTIKGFLDKIKQTTLKDFENQDYPFEDLVEKVSLVRDTGRNPLFDTMFAVQKIEKSGIEIPGLKLKPDDYESKVSKFDITLYVLEIDEKLYFNFEYCNRLFKKETIERFNGYFQAIVSRVLENPDQEISAIEIISPEEKKRILLDFNDTTAEYPRDKTVHQLFAEQAEKHPDNIAVIGEMQSTKRQVPGTMSCALTYRKLSTQTNRLAYILTGKGVKPDIIVGIMVERSIEMIIGILGILKAGGAYLPIDPDYPRERIDYMLKDSNAGILLTHKDITPSPSTLTSTSTCQVSPTNLAYVIYTSGTTGKPKGVLINHSSAVNLAVSQKRNFNIDKHDRILQFSSLCFDASVEQIFIALSSSAVLVLIDKKTLQNIFEFESYIIRQSVTHVHTVPSFLKNVRMKDAYNVRRVISGGDLCPVELAKRWSKKCSFYNKYGPTETTVTSIQVQIKEVDGYLTCLPIGKPIYNTTVYILDEWLKIVPVGVTGKMYISGEGVARGYLNRPELTVEKFVISHSSLVIREPERPLPPLIPNDGSSSLSPNDRLYRTGDLARWLPDGNIEFLGRIDHQVKIRGFRIELGEIENRLLNHREIKEAIVIAREDKDDKHLCAYIIAERKVYVAEHEEINKLRKYLSQYLPDYMVPSYFVQMDNIPLTPSGKIDRKSLPLPRAHVDETFAPPGDEIQKRLVEIWSDLTGIEKEKISIDANFFELGGHSLKAVLMTAKIHEIFNINIPVTKIFKEPTIRGIAGLIEAFDWVYDDNVDRRQKREEILL